MSHALPSGVASGISLRNKLDLYIYLAGDLGDRHEFDCIQRLRRSGDPNVAFAPMMLVAGRLTHASLEAAINAGFDDILLHPVGPNDLQARIVAAVTSPRVFYQSSDYVGPDRRRGLLSRTDGPERRERSGRVFRLMIERSIAGGCRVRRTERIDVGQVDETAEGALQG